jgi:HAD superfamily hydrolase (TIGR01509 family)
MLVIFDCDGVLVDSETLAARVFAEHLAKFGVVLSATECEAKFRGHTMDYCLGILNTAYPGVLPYDFLDSLAAATQGAFGRELRPVRGVETVLQWLQTQGLPFCVASNGALSKVQHSLEVTGLRDYFGDHCYSAEQVRRGKPHPDLFLFAAQGMGAGVADTVVVEDSIAGVTAAMQAEMKVLRYGTPVEIERRSITSFTDMEKLPRMIEKVLNPRGD